MQLEALDEIYAGDSEDEEARYYKLGSIINKTIKERTSPEESNLVVSTARIKLPKISLPLFQGDYKEWSAFRDLFVKLIHDNSQISNAEKLYYLKASLKGEASRLIQNIESSADNYETAWQEILRRYDNKVLMLNKHLKAIFDMPRVTKGSGNSLRKLICEFSQHLSSLESLKINNLHESILIFILSLKLDSEMLCAFQMTQSSDTVPTLSDFTNYLKDKATALELNSKGDDVRSSVKSERHSVHNTVVKRYNNCMFCNNGSHPLYRCYQFINADLPKRHSSVKQKQLCHNCLRTHQGHCSYTANCKTCDKRHHSLLHGSDKSTASNASKSPPSCISTTPSYTNSSQSFQSKNTNLSAPSVSQCNSESTSAFTQTCIAPSQLSDIMLMATSVVDVTANDNL